MVGTGHRYVGHECSHYEGYRVAFNGTGGRLDLWMHENQPWPMGKYDEIQITDNFGTSEFIKLPHGDEEDHSGGDPLMKEKIFRNTSAPDTFKRAANVRDRAMAVLIGVAARKSIDS